MSLALQLFLPFPNSCQGTSPHQQGRGTKMTEHCYCGIDVAKERLDVQVLPHRQRFWVDNNATGWAELVERLHALPIAAVGIEPSGGYERGIIRALLAAGLSVRRINPSKLRQFARAGRAGSGTIAEPPAWSRHVGSPPVWRTIGTTAVRSVER